MMLREKRKNAGMTVKELATRSNLAASAVSDFERGARRPWPNAMKALARALDCGVRDLFGDEVARRERELYETLGLVAR